MKDQEFKDFLEFIMKETLPLCKIDDSLVQGACININKKAHELHKKIERQPHSNS
jgi:hypothetical protein